MGDERIREIPAPAVAPDRSAGRRAWAPGPVHRWLLTRADAFWALVTGRPVSLYATAVLRIGYGLLYLVFLLREFPHRDEIWGPDSPWTPALAAQLFDQTGWYSFLILSDSRVYFELCYALALVTSTLFMMGWRTRATSVLFAAVVASFHARAIFMTDGGDNLVLLMALYLVLTACGRRWSLDARRERIRAARADGAPRRAGGRAAQQLREARRTLATVVHNCGVFVIAAQVCFLYGSAGLYKVQGSFWDDGTALHYVLNLDLFRPWPELSHVVDQYPLVLAVVGYLTVLTQVAFPFVLFGRLKYPVLAALLGMHLAIAVVLGLPLFSATMIIADAVFLPDRFYLFLAHLLRRAARRDDLPAPAPGRVSGLATVPRPADGRRDPAPSSPKVPEQVAEQGRE
ncbi:HTTM domain-containing protein [Streptomyces sp. SLBN-31]|uniref:HTTM domain-containing protein n=1 Tax=Streptomyces sp. SLBN-31 TaxID=2768444 RepID=UPI0011545477|nr:HTTM domain-containing protein [Streptomyces sp. SLBN-31]TQJ75650.1 vitamin K-dependent gamma-carboxylase-like protein [Streptomyces sp. SLBN-31]